MMVRSPSKGSALCGCRPKGNTDPLCTSPLGKISCHKFSNTREKREREEEKIHRRLLVCLFSVRKVVFWFLSSVLGKSLKGSSLHAQMKCKPNVVTNPVKIKIYNKQRFKSIFDLKLWRPYSMVNCKLKRRDRHKSCDSNVVKINKKS